jgi:hypothetical protein
LISSDNYREEGNKQGETEREKQQDKEKNSHWYVANVYSLCLIFSLSAANLVSFV